MANWIPVTVVPTSLATVAMATFMTEVSRVMRNCAAANVSSTTSPPEGGRAAVSPVSVTPQCAPDSATWVTTVGLARSVAPNGSSTRSRDAGI